MFNFRKLAAIDILFLGYKTIFVEYVSGVVLPIGLAILTFAKGHSVWPSALGVYLICLGINYVPMLVYTISIGSRENARAELKPELSLQRETMARYRQLSVLLLVPFIVPVAALVRTKR